MPDKSGAPFDPRRLDDRQRPGDIVGNMFNHNAGTNNGSTEIRIFGVGGGGNNAINRMVEAELSGVGFIAVNSDAQDLARCQTPQKIAIGDRTTRSLGAGGDPILGERAATESQIELEAAVTGAEMVFVTAGMGGGTGTGAAPVIGQIAKDAGALTVAVVTTPFSFEGSQRRHNAEAGIAALEGCVDAMVVVHNDRILNTIHKNTTMSDAFRHADTMLLSGVRGISDLITNVGIVNVDFADVRSIVKDAGSALMGVGSAMGEARAQTALEAAMHSPLIDTTLEGATGILVNITAGEDLSIHEIETVVKGLSEVAILDARVVFGAVVDPRPIQTLTVTIIATGLNGPETVPTHRARRLTNSSLNRTVTTREERHADDAVGDTGDPNPTGGYAAAPALVTPQPVMHQIDTGSSADLNDIEIPAFIRRRHRI